ncbi:MAG: aspartoacylase [Nostocaceae cyanobacterium]|nr:aspartoacylase [Nostocaceae cyanobacterium]
MKQIKRVVIVGGTHGNELTGIFIVKKFERSPELIVRSNFESLTLLGNPKAYAIGRRYVETDLNRCFQSQILENRNLAIYEAIRAQEIYNIIGCKGSHPADLIIDLHSTTANMGLTIIPASKHPFNLQLAAYLTSINPDVKVYRWQETNQDSPFLRSICEFGCAIEVGPIAPGVLDANLFQQTEALIHVILDYVEAYNKEIKPEVKDTLTIYQTIQVVDYPRNESGEIQAMVHPRLQFRDYQELHPGEPMFLTFDGQRILYEGESIVYPAFINEAAYYEKGIAMCLTSQQREIV